MHHGSCVQLHNLLPITEDRLCSYTVARHLHVPTVFNNPLASNKQAYTIRDRMLSPHFGAGISTNLSLGSPARPDDRNDGMGRNMISADLVEIHIWKRLCSLTRKLCQSHKRHKR
jgi:hypothetical protein